LLNQEHVARIYHNDFMNLHRGYDETYMMKVYTLSICNVRRLFSRKVAVFVFNFASGFLYIVGFFVNCPEMTWNQ
jgi:hypothetical protein